MRIVLLTWNHLLYVLAHKVTILSVAIADCEDMKAQLVLDVRHKHIGILVWLLRVAWNVANACGKSKLGDAIEPIKGFFR
jgi:hypothetical protein